MRKTRQKQQETSTPDWSKDFLQNQEDRRREDSERLETLITAITANNATPNAQTQTAESRAKLQNVARPTKLDVDITYSKFRSWRNAFKDYAMLQKLHDMPVALQRADFRCCLTEQMRLYLKCAMNISDDTNFSIDQIMDIIQAHLRQKRNVALDRVAFDERKQEKGETFDEYYVAIRKLSEEADLCGTCLDQRLTTKIILT